MRLWLSDEQAHEIIRFARDGSPYEICGLIAGQNARAELIVPIANIADEPRYRYRMDANAQVKAMYTFEKQNLELLGIYHSHVQGEPNPSQTDISEAYYPDVAYLIVGLRQGKARLRAWHISSGRANPAELFIGLDEDALSRAQKVAILLGAILAVAVVIVLSLILLPPAPSLPLPVP